MSSQLAVLVGKCWRHYGHSYTNIMDHSHGCGFWHTGRRAST